MKDRNKEKKNRNIRIINLDFLWPCPASLAPKTWRRRKNKRERAQFFYKKKRKRDMERLVGVDLDLDIINHII